MTSHEQLTDHQLIELYKQRNTQAFSCLVLRHSHTLLTTIHFYVQDRQLAEDLLQETFFKIINAIGEGKYNQEGKFKWWANSIAHNLCVDHLRALKRMPAFEDDCDSCCNDSMQFSVPGVDYAIVKEQSFEKIRKMLGRLNKEQQEVIIMKHFAGLPFKEIARLTGCSINTALSRMRHGLVNLRKMVAENNIALEC